MTERWQNELKKLGGVDVPTGRIHARMAQGPSDEPAQGEPGRSLRQRITAGVVAFAVFGAAGVFAYGALKPLGGSGHSPSTGGLPTLVFDLTTISPAPAIGSDPYNLTATFGEAHVTIPTIRILSTQEPSQAGPLLDLALTSGAPVTVTSDVPTFGVTLTPAAGFGSPDQQPSMPIADGATVPAPGRYILGFEVKLSSPAYVSQWANLVDVVPPGTVQFFSPTGNGIQVNPSQTPAPGAVPDIQLLIDGQLFAGGPMANGGPTIPYPGAQIAPGAPVWVGPNVTAAFSSLTATSSSADASVVIGGAPPPGQIGTAALTPGDYFFVVSAKGSTWAGDLGFLVTVRSGDSPSPQPSPSWSSGTLAVKLQTTLASKNGCPGIPDGVASFAGSERKLNGNSFTWTCPDGSSAVYDVTAPAFTAKDFISVPQGTRLLLKGDLTGATGSLRDGTGTFPWPTLQDYGDLIGGVSLDAAPGRYVVAITATWPEGNRLFWVPVEIVAPSSPTPSPSSGAVLTFKGQNPPDATLTYGDTVQQGIRSDYTWQLPDGTFSAVSGGGTFMGSPASDYLSIPAGTQISLSGDSPTVTGQFGAVDGRNTVVPFTPVAGYGSVPSQPGLYEVMVKATWPLGSGTFYFGVKVTPPVPSPTEAPPVSAASRILVSCGGGAPQIRTDVGASSNMGQPTVALRSDGLHFRVVGAVPPNIGIEFVSRDTGVAMLFDSVATDQLNVWAADPGIYDMKCVPLGSGVDPATINAAASVRVVDPTGYWPYPQPSPSPMPSP